MDNPQAANFRIVNDIAVSDNEELQDIDGTSKSSFEPENLSALGDQNVVTTAWLAQFCTNSADSDQLFNELSGMGVIDDKGNISQTFSGALNPSQFSFSVKFKAMENEVLAGIAGLLDQVKENSKESFEINKSNLEYINNKLKEQETELIKRSDENKTKQNRELKQETDKKLMEKEAKLKSIEREKGYVPPQFKNGFLV